MKRFAVGVLSCTLCLLALIAAGQMAGLLWQGHASAAGYRRLARQAVAESPADQPASSVDFAALQAQNPELCAWLRWPAIGVDLPVAHTGDNAFYLTHGWDGAPDRAGCLFVQADCAADFSGAQTIVYGHNMADGRMLGRLADYRREEFWRGAPTFWLFVPGHAYRGQVFACCPTTDGSALYQTGFATPAARADWVAALQGAALYHTGLAPAEGQRVVLFSTCDNRTAQGRLLVAALLNETTEFENEG